MKFVHRSYDSSREQQCQTRQCQSHTVTRLRCSTNIVHLMRAKMNLTSILHFYISYFVHRFKITLIYNVCLSFTTPEYVAFQEKAVMGNNRQQVSW